MSPWAAGGTNDLLCRLLAREAGRLLGQPMVVENKPGASGVIGTTAVARAKADGYTLTLGSTPGYATAQALYPQLPYDPLRDFAPVIGVATVPNVLVVPPSLPVHSVRELIAYVKARPGQLSYSSVGQGSTQHLCAKLFERMTGTEMIHVPYKGTAPALQDLLAGRITLAFENMPPLLPQIRSGALTALAVTSATRVSQLPQVPTVAESGLPEFTASVWYAVFAPAGVPASIMARLQEAFTSALALSEVASQLAGLGLTTLASDAAATRAFVQADAAKWGGIIRAAGIKPE
ncbi:tripartite tricarboxylate transporter substrate binding protein [Acidovorax sp. SUPP2522]|uniref:Bug family tripartite tricarboxylate transporter substrate binding protein n=1 Tax=Acidovorax sp. SUPP2522 TaxID=511900 RepID=UPI0023DE31BC|nr:tripartite tricarboxylate transporter substrate binding protein [Acidovorax sp. SUPP2522]GKT19066.1 tripartite tricarboxylate transporter substrate binding protein [Acidovorax sp. SUPP2522]